MNSAKSYKYDYDTKHKHIINLLTFSPLTLQVAATGDDLELDDFEHNRVLLYPLLIAAATVVALIIVIVAVWQRYNNNINNY